jgi:hypothetical protein
LFGSSFAAFVSLGGALWLVLLLRLDAAHRPPPVEGDEDAPGALEGVGQTDAEGESMQTARRHDYRDTSSHRAGPAAASVRGKPMVRRSTGASGETAHQRLKGHVEEIIGALSDRLDDKLERLDHRLSRMENDIGHGQLDRQNLKTEIHETRRDLGELRDAMALAAPTQAQTRTKAAIGDAARSWPAKVAAGCLLFTTMVVALNNIPDAIRWLEKGYVIARGDNRSGAAQAATVPEQ